MKLAEGYVRNLSATLACAGLLFLMPASARADGETPLDLSACVTRAVEASQSLRAQEARRAAQAAFLDAAKYQRLPNLSVSGSYSHSGEVEGGQLSVLGTPVTLPSPLQDSTALRVQLQQPVYTGGRIEAGVRAAEALARSASAQAAAARAATAGAAEKAYWGLYLAQEGESAAREALSATREHSRDASRRLAQGATTRSEVLSWELRTVQAELAVGSAGTRRAQTAAALCLLLGLPWDYPIAVAAPPDPHDELLVPSLDSAGMDALLKAALSSRADLADVSAQAEAGAAALDKARGALLPNVSLTGSFLYSNPNPKAFPQRDAFEPYWEVGIVASMDMGGIPANLARVREAEENAKAARARILSAEQTAKLEVVTAAIAVQDARRRIDASAKAIDLARENLRVSEDRYAAGMALDSEIADAESALLNVRLERVGARVSWELARAALRDSSGGSAEEAISKGAAHE